MCIRPSVRYFDHVFEELGVRNWCRAVTLHSADVCWRAVIMCVPAQVSKRTLFDPSINCSNHVSATKFGSVLESFSLTFCTTHRHRQKRRENRGNSILILRTLVNSLEIIFDVRISPAVANVLNQLSMHAVLVFRSPH